MKATDSGCRFWWFEYGGRLDTVHQTEAIKWVLWKVAYGVWDYIKNSGKFPEAETMTLEWVGAIPGKRESRRFEGDYILTQRDIVEQREHEDAVSFGGWAMDLHPADGLYSALSPCTQWHSKGVYQIPYRTMYSRNVDNLFLTGRLISVSHVAFGSTRVMATCAHNGQAVGMAAALCLKHGVAPRAVPIGELQRELLKRGQHIPGLALHDPGDLARLASVLTSSCFELEELPPSSDVQPLDVSRAMLLPVAAGRIPALTILVDVERATALDVEVRGSCRPANFTPEITLHRQRIELSPGRAQTVHIASEVSIESPRYLTYCLLKNDDVSVYLSDLRVTGVLSLAQSMNKAVAKGTRQQPPEGSGIDSFEFWLPGRRPGGKNLAGSAEPPLRAFCGANVTNGVARPGLQPNAWVAAADDPAPSICLRWQEPCTIARIELVFDTDFDHPMESVLMGHPERDMPFCVKHYRVRDDTGALLFECTDNHQTRNTVHLPAPAATTELRIEILETHGAPAAIFELRCYA
ncbi:MAG: FAD-dependent oxidoreductase [Candidatus Solibacter sp.]|nr:FAD-dependent oxidoreductase [Candidatus Solibacter sp.]